MKIDDVYILEEAVDDLNEGRSFYDVQKTGVGDYFWDCLIADIESLIIYAGVHRRKLGFYQMFAKRFPMPFTMKLLKKLRHLILLFLLYSGARMAGKISLTGRDEILIGVFSLGAHAAANFLSF